MPSNLLTERDISGRGAVVTGGAGGLGFGIAAALADAGASVLMADIDGDAAREAAERLGGGAEAAAVDVADPASVAHLLEVAAERVGPVYVLVNCAGVLSVSPVLELEWAEWNRVMSINAGGTFLCSKTFAAEMVQRGDGAIVNIASIAGKRGDPTLAHYSASKFAVVGFTQALAQELAPYGVTVNAVCPGTVPTAMTAELAARWGESVEAMAKRFQASPRPQEPAEIGAAVVFLARMRSITGQALNVDGGSVFS
jgi:meso-butanediol dehydrogenase/(S,S)-butanediol dehydrogenase/diacetyl reductase